MTLHNVFQLILNKQAKLHFKLNEDVSLFENKKTIQKCLELSRNIVYLLHSYKAEQKKLIFVQKSREENNYQFCFLKMIKLHQYINIYIFKIIKHSSKCPVMTQKKRKRTLTCECTIFVHYIVQQLLDVYKSFLNVVYEKELLYVGFFYAYLKCIDISYRGFKHIYNNVRLHHKELSAPWNNIEKHRQKFILYMHNTNIKRSDLFKKALINCTILNDSDNKKRNKKI